MTNTPVTPVMEMMIGGEWVDITEDVRLSSADSGGGINITRGTPNEGNAAEPTQLDFTLNNKDGKYSPRNPYSENYGKLGRNTPVRLALSRRTDTFDRTEADSWGRMPSWVDSEGNTRLGDRWQIVGTSSAFDVSGGVGTIQAAAGYRMAVFGTYGDVEIKTRVKVSTRDSEFGIVMRAADVSAGTDAGDFESGLGAWTPTGGTSTLQASTVQFHTGTTSALLTISGSPASAYARPAAATVNPGGTYRARMWVRCSIATTVTASIDWLDSSLAYLSGAYNGVAVAANTWTVLEVTGVAPDAAAYGSYGPNLTTPPNGTLLFIDDVEFLSLSEASFYTAYITPGTPDSLRLGVVDTGSGLASSVNLNQDTNIVAGDWWWMKAQISGIRRRVKWWKDGTPEPSFWNWRTYTVAAATSTDAVPPMTGMVGLFAKDGTALVSFDSVEVNVWRAHAEIAELPPRWDLSRQDRWVPITARGVLRRLGQGRKALESPVSLHLNEYTTSRMWIPLETVDGDSNLAGNKIADGAPALIRHLTQGTPDSSGTFALPGVSGCAVFDQDDSYLIARAKPGAAAGIWSLMVFFRIPAPPASDILLYQVESSGTARRFLIYLQTDSAIRVEARDSNNVLLGSGVQLLWFGTAHPTGCWIAANLYVFTSGGTVFWAWNYHRPGNAGSFFTNNGSFAGSAGIFREVRFNSSSVHTAAGNLSIAHVFHYPGDLPFVTDAFARAAYAYIGEEAVTRYLRLTQNAGIYATTTGFTSDSKPMGAQTPSKLLDLLDECAEVDDSILMEERDDFGLNMRTRESLWNQRTTLLDIDAGHLSAPLDPSTDDQRTRNDVTVTRPNGGFYRSVQLDGPLNVNNPEDDVNGVGTYDETPEINYHTDDQLQPAANWRRSKGTIEEPRYPQVNADLTASAYQDDPALTAELLAKDSGDVIEVLNTEVDYNPVEQMIASYTEKIDMYDHALTFTGVPGAPWRVGVVGQTTRLATRYQALAASFNAGVDTRLSAARTLPGGLWVQVADSPESFPFDIDIEGCRLTVRSTGDVLNFNGHFDTGISGWFGNSSTLYWDRYRNQHKSGVGALRMTATAAATGGATQQSANQSTVVAGTTYQISGWLRTNVVLTDVRIAVDWYQADGTTFISTGMSTAVTTVANTWVHVSAQVVAPALAARARLRARAVFLAIGNILWADDMRLMPVSSFSGSPQTLTVDQAPVNGVIKTLNSGAKIEVAHPWRVAF